MRYQHIILTLGLLVLLTASSCGYRLQNSFFSNVPIKIKSLTLSSYDPYGLLTRAVRTELYLNNIVLVDKNENKNIISLKIINSSENLMTASVYRGGETAEYYITMNIQAQLLIPNKNYYPIDVKVYRSFFNNPFTATSKDVVVNILRQELYQQAAQHLVRKILVILLSERRNNMLKD